MAELDRRILEVAASRKAHQERQAVGVWKEVFDVFFYVIVRLVCGEGLRKPRRFRILNRSVLALAFKSCVEAIHEC